MNKHEEYQEALDFYWKVYEKHHLGMLARHYIDILKELVDKATPKKVDKYSRHKDLEPTFFCPLCENIVEKEQKHCPECGQKLDWSDEDDK